MRHVDAVMCATDAAADALLLCACAFISLLRPCTLCRKTKTATMKINIRQQQQVASARSTLLKDMPAAEQNSSFPWPSVGNPTQPFSSLPAIGSVVFVFTMLCLCVCVSVCAAILCALFGLTFHFVLRLAFCGLPAAAVSYRQFSHRFMASVYSIPQGDSISIRKPHTNCKQHNCVIWKGSFNFWISVLSLLKLCKYEAWLRVHLTRQLRKCIIVQYMKFLWIMHCLIMNNAEFSIQMRRVNLHLAYYANS